MIDQKIRTRFAPSPTGLLHVGGLRTALYGYLFAKKYQGDFVLRIEDTDQNRFVTGALEGLLNILSKMGLQADEGPFLDSGGQVQQKGDYGPYIQSQRLELYAKYAQELLAKKQAYYCFCSSERLDDLRKTKEQNKQATRYDRKCLELTENEVTDLLAQKNPYVIRLKVPAGEVSFTDLIRGEIKVKSEDIDDQVLVKSDGYPTYHLAVVVDDHLMKITHVIRGEEWLPSTPKHVLLYRALEWETPVFAHLANILNSDRTKLSKRQGDVAAEDFLQKGYLPEALINYLALMGWHPQGDNEFFTLSELVENFDLTKVQKSGAIFDPVKLDWMNHYYISKLSTEQLVSKISEYLPKISPDLLEKLIIISQPRLNKLQDIQELAKPFMGLEDYEAKNIIFKKSDLVTTANSLTAVITELTGIGDDWSVEVLEKSLSRVVSENLLTNGDVFWPVRYALSGLDKSPSPVELLWVLGKEESLRRLKIAQDKLNGLHVE